LPTSAQNGIADRKRTAISTIHAVASETPRPSFERLGFVWIVKWVRQLIGTVNGAGMIRRTEHETV